jgi:DNA (cytosine-5)-methyltransferase 1
VSLRVLSTFSGISAASVAWKPLGFEFVGYAEIEPFPCHLLATRRGTSRPIYMPDPDDPAIDLLPTEKKRKQERAARIKRIKETRNLPESGVPNFGDISQITDDDLQKLGRVDVLEGGSPCQSFSSSGLRQGLNDPRGNLMLVFCHLAERMRRINGTRYVIWENVYGVLTDKTNGFGCLLGALAGEDGPLVPPGKRWSTAGNVLGPEGSISWRVLDAQFFGVPQRRRRVFVVADFGDRSGASGTVLFEPKGERRDLEASRGAGKEIADCVRNSVASVVFGFPGNWIGRTPKNGGNATEPMVNVAPCLTRTDIHAVAYALCDDYEPKAAPELAYTLLSGSPTGGGHKQMVIHSTAKDAVRWVVRRLMPIECERLQGFPNGWTDIEIHGKPVADGPRYKALGNSMAVPCVRIIGGRLSDYHNEQIMNDFEEREAA